MARLPTPGGDRDSWGIILNDYLAVSHDTDGTLKANVVGDNQVTTLSLSKITGLAATLNGKIQLGGDIGGSISAPALKNVAKLFNITDYGAVGNGTVDDTAAIQAAIDAASAAGGGTVFVPAAIFGVNPATGIHLDSNITFIGNGRSSVLKILDGTNATGNLVRAEAKTNVTIANLLLDGNRSAQSSGTNYGLYVATSVNCKITNVWTDNFTGVGSHVYDCDGVTVSGCTASNNTFHGFECEQARGCIWQGNHGYNNDRHGIFISPGEVGGSGAKGNVIAGNSFHGNSQYGIAVGVAAAPGSELLSLGNIISDNSVRNNAQYGISLFHQDGSIVQGNVIEGNGYFGIYCYKTRNNNITGNRLHNNSQSANNGYDEIMLEGDADGRSSRDNVLAENTILIDGATKARYAINEATANDGPNNVVNNMVPAAGSSGSLRILNAASIVSSPAGVYQVRGGQAIDGANAGIDNAFGILRIYSNLSNAEVQVVSTTGGIKFWSNGTERFLINSDGSVVANTDTFRLSTAKTPASATAPGTAGDIAWDSNFIYICVATNTWKRVGISAW